MNKRFLLAASIVYLPVVAMAADAIPPAPTLTQIEAAWTAIQSAWSVIAPILNWVLWLVGSGAAAAAYLPQWQGGALGKIRAIIDLLGLNVGNAKNVQK